MQLSMLNRLLTLCGKVGAARRAERVDALEAPSPVSTPRASLQKGGSRMGKVVSVDNMTSVPSNLYEELVRAGEQARERGQHRLIEYTPSESSRSSSQGSSSIPIQHLVREEFTPPGMLTDDY
mmetsp:Transcript_17526/g.40806  ORF Transcript_17526/g.40806 Transcript_17526/m.40806 type:complete len:123 (-) Transcript_17526:191-559(-)|eukprot:CAMPEP_0178375278 /NCGR_PEP_ID=MMETSP0689_2-20121128/2803_1 /TAXON_ID=160604 /ORGANISM="Amphidinium massartii, Strain CS-259" /LENGTH=122 /DNA_ID=CAMNT_0019995261 /DNA_START=57 /DNA_END=425 /DNA_ORIENTATION=-